MEDTDKKQTGSTPDTTPPTTPTTQPDPTPPGPPDPAPSPDLEALRKRLAELEDENEALKKKAKKGKADEQSTAEPPPGPSVKVDDYLEERIIVNLFCDNEKYKDDVDVCVNGERILIKRGVDVAIKRKHALVLQQSMKQDDYARAIIKQFTDEYTAKEKAYT